MAKSGRPKLNPGTEYTRLTIQVPVKMREKLGLLAYLNGFPSITQYIVNLCEQNAKEHEVELETMEKMRKATVNSKKE